MMHKPLSGIRILDLSRVLAGPWCTQLLADLGAEVIKIEKPGHGDDTRAWGPPFLEDKGAESLSAYYISCNRNKKSVTIDMACPDGADLIRQLAGKSDVIIENFKLGGLKKYGLDYDSVKKIRPDIIYCSITGFGQDGPSAPKAGYDFMIQGLCGLMSVTGEPAGMPQKDGVALVDVMTGMYSASSILAALYARKSTGQGTYIDMALMDVGVAMMANQALNYLVSGQVPRRMGNAHPNIVPYQAFATRDGHVILAIGNDDQFARFARACGQPEWAQNDMFATNEARVKNRGDVTGAIAVVMHQKTTAEWIAILERENIPGGPINNMEEVFRDPQVVHRGIHFDLPDANGVMVPQVASPIHFDGKNLHNNTDTPPPHLGQHTDDVLKSILGCDAAAIKKLRDDKIV